MWTLWKKAEMILKCSRDVFSNVWKRFSSVIRAYSQLESFVVTFVWPFRWRVSSSEPSPWSSLDGEAAAKEERGGHRLRRSAWTGNAQVWGKMLQGNGGKNQTQNLSVSKSIWNLNMQNVLRIFYHFSFLVLSEKLRVKIVNISMTKAWVIAGLKELISANNVIKLVFTIIYSFISLHLLHPGNQSLSDIM